MVQVTPPSLQSLKKNPSYIVEETDKGFVAKTKPQAYIRSENKDTKQMGNYSRNTYYYDKSGNITQMETRYLRTKYQYKNRLQQEPYVKERNIFLDNNKRIREYYETVPSKSGRIENVKLLEKEEYIDDTRTSRIQKQNLTPTQKENLIKQGKMKSPSVTPKQFERQKAKESIGPISKIVNVNGDKTYIGIQGKRIKASEIYAKEIKPGYYEGIQNLWKSKYGKKETVPKIQTRQEEYLSRVRKTAKDVGYKDVLLEGDKLKFIVPEEAQRVAELNVSEEFVKFSPKAGGLRARRIAEQKADVTREFRNVEVDLGSKTFLSGANPLNITRRPETELAKTLLRKGQLSDLGKDYVVYQEGGMKTLLKTQPVVSEGKVRLSAKEKGVVPETSELDVGLVSNLKPKPINLFDQRMKGFKAIGEQERLEGFRKFIRSEEVGRTVNVFKGFAGSLGESLIETSRPFRKFGSDVKEGIIKIGETGISGTLFLQEQIQFYKRPSGERSIIEEGFGKKELDDYRTVETRLATESALLLNPISRGILYFGSLAQTTKEDIKSGRALLNVGIGYGLTKGAGLIKAFKPIKTLSKTKTGSKIVKGTGIGIGTLLFGSYAASETISIYSLPKNQRVERLKQTERSVAMLGLGSKLAKLKIPKSDLSESVGSVDIPPQRKLTRLEKVQLLYERAGTKGEEVAAKRAILRLGGKVPEKPKPDFFRDTWKEVRKEDIGTATFEIMKKPTISTSRNLLLYKTQLEQKIVKRVERYPSSLRNKLVKPLYTEGGEKLKLREAEMFLQRKTFDERVYDLTKKTKTAGKIVLLSPLVMTGVLSISKTGKGVKGKTKSKKLDRRWSGIRENGWIKEAREEGIQRGELLYNRQGWGSPSNVMRARIFKQKANVKRLTTKDKSVSIIKQKDKLFFGNQKFEIKSVGFKVSKPTKTKGTFANIGQYDTKITGGGVNVNYQTETLGLSKVNKKGFEGFDILYTPKETGITTYEGVKFLTDNDLSRYAIRTRTKLTQQPKNILQKKPEQFTFDIQKDILSKKINDVSITDSEVQGFAFNKKAFDKTFTEDVNFYYLENVPREISRKDKRQKFDQILSNKQKQTSLTTIKFDRTEQIKQFEQRLIENVKFEEIRKLDLEENLIFQPVRSQQIKISGTKEKVTSLKSKSQPTPKQKNINYVDFDILTENKESKTFKEYGNDISNFKQRTEKVTSNFKDKFDTKFESDTTSDTLNEFETNVKATLFTKGMYDTTFETSSLLLTGSIIDTDTEVVTKPTVDIITDEELIFDQQIKPSQRVSDLLDTRVSNEYLPPIERESKTFSAAPPRGLTTLFPLSTSIKQAETINIETTEIDKPNPPEPKKPEKPVRPKMKFEFDGMYSLETPKEFYNVEVREKGKFVKVNKQPLPKFKAMNLGANIVANTPSASFTIKPTKKKSKIKDDQRFEYMLSFRKSKRNPKILVEKKAFRIDTEGEIRGISVKGYLTQLRRTRWKRLI